MIVWANSHFALLDQLMFYGLWDCAHVWCVFSELTHSVKGLSVGRAHNTIALCYSFECVHTVTWAMWCKCTYTNWVHKIPLYSCAIIIWYLCSYLFLLLQNLHFKWPFIWSITSNFSHAILNYYIIFHVERIWDFLLEFSIMLALKLRHFFGWCMEVTSVAW